MAEPGEACMAAEHLASYHPMCAGASLHSIPPSVKPFLASDHKTLLLNNLFHPSWKSFSWELNIAWSKYSCLSVPLMNLPALKNEILTSTWFGASLKEGTYGGMWPGLHEGRWR